MKARKMRSSKLHKVLVSEILTLKTIIYDTGSTTLVTWAMATSRRPWQKTSSRSFSKTQKSSSKATRRS